MCVSTCFAHGTYIQRAFNIYINKQMQYQCFQQVLHIPEHLCHIIWRYQLCAFIEHVLEIIVHKVFLDYSMK